MQNLFAEQVINAKRCVKFIVTSKTGINYTMLRQWSLLTIICFINCYLVDCSWMSLYIPKLDTTCVLTEKAIRHEDVHHIKQTYCSMESCVADCVRLLPSCKLIKYSPFAKVCNLYYENATDHILQPIDQIGQSIHLLLHSCHKDFSNIPVGIMVPSVYQRNNSATIHTPSTHKNCHFYELPFVENFYAQRIHLITTISLNRCIAFCQAPTYTSCNSVLFSAQEGTCLLLSRATNSTFFGGIIPTLQTSALFFIISVCFNDFDFPHAYSIPRFGEIAPTVYNIFNVTVSLYCVHFYATKAGIRLRLWETVDESQCLMICLDNFLADNCDAYYFSYGEKTCLTFRIRKTHALQNSPFNRHIIKFSDDGILINIAKDPRMLRLKHSNHFTTEAKVSLFQFKEICTVKHSVSNVIPWINLVQLYANVSFLNECISICRFKRNFGLCQGIAYSKESKACLTTVLGNYEDEVYLNEGYHFFTLNNCSKDRGEERADNDQPELHLLPILDEVCQLEFYKPLFLSGWSLCRHTNAVLFTSLMKAAFYSKECVTCNIISSEKGLLWKPFVGNRVESILELTDAQWWRHCPTADNPADILTRGCRMTDLMEIRVHNFVLHSIEMVRRRYATESARHQDDVNKGRWMMGRVLEPLHGRDGVVRSVRLKVAKGEITRPTKKLRQLEPAVIDGVPPSSGEDLVGLYIRKTGRNTGENVTGISRDNRQWSTLAIIFFINCYLVDCSWMSLYIPKLDTTCVLIAKAIRHEDVHHIKQTYCSMESCVAACVRLLPSCNLIKYSPFAKVCNLYYENATVPILPQIDQIGQSMHLLLHSCHKDISSIPAGIIVQSVYQRNKSATIHTPSTHKNCHFYELPFVESFYAERVHLIVTSSLKRCIAFCEAPTYTSCNSVLFSAQEETCLLLSGATNSTLFGGIIPTLQTSALFFIISTCYNDFDFPYAYSIPRFEEIAPTVYNIFNVTVSLYRVHFYATKAGIRIGLWETENDNYCLMICIDEFLADYCDGYYFSHGENTCLTFNIEKKYALPNSPLNRRIIQFFDEICTVQHSISNVIPWINLVQQYENISYLNDCIRICRFIRDFGLCQGVAYSKESKVCVTAVFGNNDDEVYLNEGYHFLTLSNCSKDRENERADNDPPELHVCPILDEVCQLEFYEPLFLTGWSVIIEIRNIATLQECVTNCAAVMHAGHCAAIYFIHQSCFLLERMTHLQNHFIRENDSVFAELLFCEPNIRYTLSA
ncbi:hypothetical protein T01_10666 [Trichinella spiralis]|uniref:DUF5641 domain-containing protein n=1 Tax=Trichinella spiralis TaxID=6334 RepID=A0A0V1B1L5_TRISP|nr:hypothetical protein T01_10666 [Trichinella spiralis]